MTKSPLCKGAIDESLMTARMKCDVNHFLQPCAHLTEPAHSKDNEVSSAVFRKGTITLSLHVH